MRYYRYFYYKNQNLTSIYLQERDQLKINNIINLFKPIFITIEVLLSSTYLTISNIKLNIIGLLQYLESFIKNLINLKECIIANLINFKFKEYWKYVKNLTIISILLDL